MFARNEGLLETNQAKQELKTCHLLHLGWGYTNLSALRPKGFSEINPLKNGLFSTFGLGIYCSIGLKSPNKNVCWLAQSLCFLAKTLQFVW